MFDMLRLKLSISLNPRISSGRPWRFVVSIGQWRWNSRH